MPRYRKKPVVIEAVQWTGVNLPEIESFLGLDELDIKRSNSSIFIHTLEGTMEAAKGDYIIKGVKGEFYPCKPDIFEETYDVEEG